MPVFMAAKIRFASVSRNAQMAFEGRRRPAGPQAHSATSLKGLACNVSSAAFRQCAGRTTHRCVYHYTIQSASSPHADNFSMHVVALCAGPSMSMQVQLQLPCTPLTPPVRAAPATRSSPSSYPQPSL